MCFKCWFVEVVLCVRIHLKIYVNSTKCSTKLLHDVNVWTWTWADISSFGMSYYPLRPGVYYITWFCLICFEGCINDFRSESKT